MSPSSAAAFLIALAVTRSTVAAAPERCEDVRKQAAALASSTTRRDALRLHLARCLRDAGRIEESAAEYRAIAAAGPLSRSLALLDEASSFLSSRSLPPGDVFDHAVDVDPPRERSRREALGRVLLLLSRSSTTAPAARAADRLWLELPDVPAARELLATPAGREREARATREEAIRRARVLLDAPDPPAAVAVLQRFPPGPDDASPPACEARVLLARSLRRMGRTTDAISAARIASARCDAGTAAEAAYLDIVLTSGRDDDPEAQVEEFLQRFPQDTRCDDVLLQRAQLFLRGPQPQRAVPLLERMLARYPDGDMAHEARFLLALVRAQEGKTSEARRILDESARLAPRGDIQDRAIYWSARLRLHPKLDRLDPGPDDPARAGAIAELAQLSESRFGSHYALLARTLLREPSKPTRRASIAPGSVVPRPPRLASDPEFLDALALSADGFVAEAGTVLDLVADRLAPLSDVERLALSAVFRSVRDDARAYQMLRAGDGRAAVAVPGPKDPGAPAAWELLYPALFRTELGTAAASAGIPAELLRALAREESTLDARAVSPTGAVGLCQIQEPAAREAAAILRAVPSRAELLDPALNATIGATYLRKRLDSSLHPLLALAAYNRGPTSIAALARKLGSIPVDTFVERIPARETREYVKRVAGSWDAYTSLDGGGSGITFPMRLRSAASIGR